MTEDNIVGQIGSNSEMAWVEIDHSALRRNLLQIKEQLEPETKLSISMKSDAYGHGLVRCAETVVGAGVDRIGLANLDEVAVLRHAGITIPLMVLYPILCTQVQKVVELGAELTVSASQYDFDLLPLLSNAADMAQQQVNLHVWLDSGLGRFGTPASDVESISDFLKRIDALSGVNTVAIGTQLADDLPDSERSLAQIDVFDRFLAEVDMKIPEEKHICNSAGITYYPQAIFNSVRPGLAIYGAANSQPNYKSVMSFHSVVQHVKKITAGSRIGYGDGFELRESARIGFIAAGYGDGIDRRLSPGMSVLVQGRPAPLIGRISMNSCAIDLTEHPEVEVGDRVVLIGRQGDAEILLQDWASHLGTIVNELMVRIGNGLRRHHISECHLESCSVNCSPPRFDNSME